MGRCPKLPNLLPKGRELLLENLLTRGIDVALSNEFSHLTLVVEHDADERCQSDERAPQKRDDDEKVGGIHGVFPALRRKSFTTGRWACGPPRESVLPPR